MSRVSFSGFDGASFTRDLMAPLASPARDSVVLIVPFTRDLMAPLASPARDSVVLIVPPSRGPLSPPMSLLRCPAAPLVFPVCVRVMTTAAPALAPVRRGAPLFFD